ncbi:MAG: alpha-amylase [Saprospiraceae bacterium]|nr:MAG: alpha amylase [Bacteroidetes bacterium OLB9]MCO6464589.1 alpha-amylase [Saprospiraceae bacterium]
MTAAFSNVTYWPEWAKASSLYEVNIRQYTPEGTFDAFSHHLERLKNMGVDILWFMPVFPISTTRRKGKLGSYYAVSDYRAVNPELGSKASLKQLIDQIHALGMYIIIDWVPNHTGWDHVWMEQHPDFYTKDISGKISEPLDNTGKSIGWTDVADLNYDNQKMRQTMIEDMIYWLTEMKVDGFRQDMAMLVPLDFWREVSDELRVVNQDVFMVAESEEAEHLRSGCFHAIYGWNAHHLFNSIAQHKAPFRVLDEWLNVYNNMNLPGSYMFFTSNHDENSWSGSEIERMGEAHQAFAVVSFTLSGIPLIYSGQEEPIPYRLKFFDKDLIDFRHFAYEGFYKSLLQLKRDNKAMWNSYFGAPVQRIMIDSPIFAFEREKDDNKVSVLVNLTPQHQKAASDRVISGKNAFDQSEVYFEPGHEIQLLPWEWLIVVNNK